MAASEYRECELTELPSLSAYTDVDALNTLFGTDRPSTPALSSGELEFEYDGLTVTVSTIGTIEVQEKQRSVE